MSKIEEIKSDIEKAFDIKKIEIKKESRLDVHISHDKITVLLTYLKNQKGYTHLSHISTVDWLEDGEFELVYILWNYEDKIQIFNKCRIPREEAKTFSIKSIWRQADTYEREMFEMYGIQFHGNEDLKEFLLEDWDKMPPMRRDFITDEYAKEAFFERPGREDANNVRDTMEKRTREILPEFAKKYSR